MMTKLNLANQQFKHKSGQALAQLHDLDLTYRPVGKLKRVVGSILEASGLSVKIGQHCTITHVDNSKIKCMVIGFNGKDCYLAPLHPVEGLCAGLIVEPDDHANKIPVSFACLGRVFSPLMVPIDGKGDIYDTSHYQPLEAHPINPMSRNRITKKLSVGVKVIDSLLTIGQGQRIGIMAGSGVGKSVLMGMITKFCEAEVIVIGLVGERGREIKEFIEDCLGDVGLQKSVVIASPADQPPLMKIQAAVVATSVAEYFRDQGKQVLLFVDSLTRYAQAQRDLALSIGEAPGAKGYPPSVLSKVNNLLERTGPGSLGQGDITAFYTVLSEGDEVNDPLIDNVRSIVDGHILLSREVASSGIYPAVNINYSASRLMNHLISKEHLQCAMEFKKYWALYEQNKELLSIGAYQKGNDAELDKAFALISKLREFVSQQFDQSVSSDDSFMQLRSIFR